MLLLPLYLVGMGGVAQLSYRGAVLVGVVGTRLLPVKAAGRDTKGVTTLAVRQVVAMVVLLVPTVFPNVHTVLLLRPLRVTVAGRL